MTRACRSPPVSPAMINSVPFIVFALPCYGMAAGVAALDG